MEVKSVSLVLPMFNETLYLEKTIPKAISVFESFLSDFEIIIVDDASYDGSERIADDLSRKDKRIRVIHHKKNRKLGDVLKTGFSIASKEIVIYTDMDMPFDFSLLRRFITLLDDADIVNGYRIAYNESFRRNLYSRVYNILIKTIFGLRVRDVNFAMKIFERNVLKSLKLKSEGSFISAEALVKAQYLRYKIMEVPVVYFPRRWGSSRLSSWSVIIKIIYEMVKFFPEISALKIKMAYIYLKAKLHNFVRRKTCPYQAVGSYIPNEGDIYDLGCGYGTFINFLPPVLNGRYRFIGFDINSAKIRFASVINKGRNVSFKVKDITEDLDVNNATCIVMIDTLMFMPFSEQEKLLGRCFNYLSEQGVLIIKEIDTRPFWKYIWHQFQETLVLKIFKLIQGKGLYCRPRVNYISLLEKIGYKVNTIDIHKGYPYPHILYICTKH